MKERKNEKKKKKKTEKDKQMADLEHTLRDDNNVEDIFIFICVIQYGPMVLFTNRKLGLLIT